MRKNVPNAEKKYSRRQRDWHGYKTFYFTPEKLLRQFGHPTPINFGRAKINIHLLAVAQGTRNEEERVLMHVRTWSLSKALAGVRATNALFGTDDQIAFHLADR